MSHEETEVASHFNATMTRGQIIEVLIRAAMVHGRDSEADHEAGDLQDSLRAAWGLLDDKQKQAFVSLDVVFSVMQGGDMMMPAVFGVPDIEAFITEVDEGNEDLDEELDDLRTLLRCVGNVMTNDQAHELPETDGIQTLMEGWPDNLYD